MNIFVLKTMGAVALAASAWFFARCLSSRRHAATVQVEGFLSLIRAIRSGVAHYTPMADILVRVEKETVMACSGQSTELRTDSLGAFLTGCVFLSEDTARLMARVEKELGRGYREEQLILCDSYLAALEEIRKQCVKREGEYRAVVEPLLTVVAVGAVILLI